jgi:hypothetical protein
MGKTIFFVSSSADGTDYQSLENCENLLNLILKNKNEVSTYRLVALHNLNL